MIGASAIRHTFNTIHVHTSNQVLTRVCGATNDAHANPRWDIWPEPEASVGLLEPGGLLFAPPDATERRLSFAGLPLPTPLIAVSQASIASQNRQ